jgi:pSer/pThr/pTyr-binding forkhead associated (FHA) protein
MLSRPAGENESKEGQRLAGYILEIIEGPEAGRTVVVENAAVELGREDGIGVQLEQDELVSRRHARLTPTADGLIVEDLESRNGTFVNGDEIFGQAQLVPGGQLLVGVTVFQLRAGTGAAPTAVRPIPDALTGPRPAPLAVEERKPDYVPDDLVAGRRDVPLNPLLDVHTKSQARHAPLAIFVLVAVVVMIALALR